jgi:hypothetical protein
MGAKRSIRAREISEDIRLGLTDIEIMEKYQVSENVLKQLYQTLVKGGVLKRTDLEFRRLNVEETVVMDNVWDVIKDRY